MQVKEALTDRELELVKLAALGMRNRHIGWRVGIAEDTVKHWFVAIFDKTGTWSRLEVAMKWVGEQGRARPFPETGMDENRDSISRAKSLPSSLR